VTASPDDPLVTVDDIRHAAQVLRGIVVRTPLLPFGPPGEGDVTGRSRVYLKPESLQPMGAFKLRGAYHALASLPADRRAGGVVTHSSGNHAQGVARAARILGMPAVIVMPTDAPRVKVAGVEADGARIVYAGTTNEERTARAHEIADEEGLELIPSFDDARIVAGQGTAGLEIVEQLAEIDAHAASDGRPPLPPPTVLVPIGGGGLAAGVATAVKEVRPDARVIGVEPVLAADAHESLRSGRLVAWPGDRVARTSADGMRTGSLGVLPFRQLRRYLDDVVLVDELEIARAMVRAASGARLVLEPSGATSLAAWLFHAHELGEPGTVVCLLSGGNVDADRYRELIALGEAAGG
jgi:threo-3-hydroxy-L-aspartate ammonia-lyase